MQINPGADVLEQGMFAGVANDTQGIYLVCFRDQGQVLFSTSVKSCRSQYYCIEVSPDTCYLVFLFEPMWKICY